MSVSYVFGRSGNMSRLTLYSLENIQDKDCWILQYGIVTKIKTTIFSHYKINVTWYLSREFTN